MLGAYRQAELTGHNSTLMETVGVYTTSGDANVLRFILKNLHFLLKNLDFLLKNVVLKNTLSFYNKCRGCLGRWTTSWGVGFNI